MRRAKNRRRRSQIQAEKRFLEAEARLETLIKDIERDKLEVRVDEVKRRAEEGSRAFLDIAVELRQIAEEEGASKCVQSIDELMQDVEKEGEQLLKNFDNLKSPSRTVRADENITTVETLFNDAREIFAQALIKLVVIHISVIDIARKRAIQDIEKRSEEIINHVSRSELLAKAMKADNQLFNDIDSLKQYTGITSRDLLAEINEQKPRQGIPRSNEPFDLKDLQWIKEKELNFYQETVNRSKHIVDELELLSQKKQRRQRVVSFLYTFFVVFSNIVGYIFWSYQEKMILPGWSEFITWALTGFILIIIHTKTLTHSTELVVKYIFKYNVKFSSKELMNSIIMYSIFIVYSFILIALMYIILIHFIYLTLFPIVDFLSRTNPALTFIGSVSAIATILIISVGDLKNRIRKIMIWLPEK